MKKRFVWLIAAAAAQVLCAPAETVITSPTGLPDESDAVLESAVNAVKTIPAETAEAVGGVISYTGDELRNTVHGIKSAFQGATPDETARKEMLGKVSADWNSAGEVIFRSYKVSPVVVKAMKGDAAADEGILDVRPFFKRVDFPDGTSACLQPEYGQLLVRNTLSNLRMIETTLAQYHRAEKDYKQVQINAKFIEVSQSKLDQLGFTWRIQDEVSADGVKLLDSWSVKDNQDVLGGALRTASGAFGSGASGAGSMVMTKTGWMPLRVAINALEQSGDSDVLSAPSLTTLDGKSAEIWVGEDRAVPHSFSVKNADVNIHIQHDGWKSELMGVNLSVKPEIQKDGMIRLSLNPKVVDLIGYDSYQISPDADMLVIQGNAPTMGGVFPILHTSTISETWDRMMASVPGISSGIYGNDINTYTGTAGSTNSAPNTYIPIYRDSVRRLQHEDMGFPLARIDGQLPYFRVREIKTQVTVSDGSTVGLGGLIYDRLETYKDKIPVLGSIPLVGRLFRSEGERSVKRNLMIFVSANRVGNDGQLKSGATINN